MFLYMFGFINPVKSSAHLLQIDELFPSEVRHISENQPLTVVLWEQEVPGSNSGATTDVTSCHD